MKSTNGGKFTCYAEGKKSSKTTKWVFKFTDGQKIIIASSTFDKIEETEPYELRASYNLEAVNFGVTQTTLTLTVTLTDKATAEEQVFKKVLTPRGRRNRGRRYRGTPKMKSPL